MADIDLTVREATSSSPTTNFTDNKTAATSANNYFFPNDGRTILLVQSGAGSNVTVETTKTVDGNTVADLVIAASAAKLHTTRTFAKAVYNNDEGKVKVTVSANTDIMAVRV